MDTYTTRQHKALETKRLIFHTAMELLSKSDDGDVRVSDICKAAGVSVGTFYYHFSTKEVLLQEGYQMFDNDLAERWEQNAPDSPLDGVHLLVQEQLNHQVELGTASANSFLRMNLINIDQQKPNENRTIFQLLTRMIASLVEEKRLTVAPQVIANEILTVTRGLIFSWCIQGGAFDLVAQGLKHTDLLLGYYGLIPSPRNC